MELCPAWRWSSTGPVYPWDTVVNINEVIAREVDGLDGTEMTCPDEVVDEAALVGEAWDVGALLQVLEVALLAALRAPDTT